MKIRDILNKDTATISFEVFPPKKSTDFGNVEAAALGIAVQGSTYRSGNRACKKVPAESDLQSLAGSDRDLS